MSNRPGLLTPQVPTRESPHYRRVWRTAAFEIALLLIGVVAYESSSAERVGGALKRLDLWRTALGGFLGQRVVLGVARLGLGVAHAINVVSSLEVEFAVHRDRRAVGRSVVCAR